MKTIDTREYVSVLREITENGSTASMVVAGNSMAPFLADQRDVICFSRPNRPLRPGDMAFFQRANGDYVMHRIIRIGPAGCELIGDAQTRPEGPIAPAQIFAVVTRVRRKGKWLSPRSPQWFFFAHIWRRMIPLRPWAMRRWAAVRRIFPQKK